MQKIGPVKTIHNRWLYAAVIVKHKTRAVLLLLEHTLPTLAVFTSPPT